MDANKLIEILRATMDPNQREAAEKQLEQVHKIIGFAPSLLQVVMMNTVELPVRQAGVIYLKNMIAQFWQDKEQEPGKPLVFSIHEQDRAMIRDSIVDALVYAADLIRVQLAVCVSNIVKHDFPGKWTGIVDKISVYLQMNDTNVCMGALLCLYQLVKNFEYKNSEERGPLNEAMNMLLPMIYQRCVQLVHDPSDVSALLQKQILKIFFALIQYFLPLNLITKDVFSQWMELLRNVVDRPIPEQTTTYDEEELAELSWWKCKKWALHILTRVFERYGSPDSVSPEYQEFSKYYLKTYTAGILEVLLKLLDQYRQKVFVSPRVLQLALNYINEAVSHSFSWKLLKPHMLTIVQDVVFPLMCSTDKDEELWTTDPHEYIRLKFDVFEDFISPVTAAQTLLHSIAKKRKDMLQKSMEFVMTVLTNQASSPRQIDGALHMVGTVADVLLKRKLYKDEMESILVAYVFPHFQSEHGFMRARACWVMHYFCSMRFQNEMNLITALQLTQNALLNDKELPVKVEAAVALQMLITNQEKAEKHLEPHIKPIALELLNILRETENDDLTNVMQKIVCTYTQQLLPIAVEMTQHLAQTFSQVINNSGDDGSDEKTITAMGILNTMDTILSVMEDHKEIMTHLEPIVLNVIGLILTQSVIEFYEESMSLIYSLSSNNISPDMWKVFELMYQTFLKDGFDFFTDMMPALHNFVRVDTQAFVSNQNHLLAIYNMCKAVLNGEAGEDAECHAAKLLEVVILQCKGMIDQCIPSFVELVLGRLTREVKTSELRTMCLQVVIAALYYNPNLLLETLEKIHMPNTTESITSHFITQWVHDTDCFLGLHDRKMCVMGLCTLISTPQLRPKVNNEVVQKIVPSMLLLFDGLKRAYAYKAQEEEGESESEEEEDFDPDVLGSDEDDVNEDFPELNKISREIKKKSPFPVTSSNIVDDDEATDDEEYEEAEETALEGYSTPLDDEETNIDEYVIFKEVMNGLKTVDPNWYNILTSHLTTEQQRAFEEVLVLADQRKAAAESKRIEKSGGYVFQNQTVPTSFNFGGTPLS
ncbi:importin-7-like [Argiope bruennichi]|uniref:importin-7-like n=1 Tax=Argiope bruennichi TaxID=94029 RepID=UPI0024948A62|nr:importin-7-like [Argiope bruennichi]